MFSFRTHIKLSVVFTIFIAMLLSGLGAYAFFAPKRIIIQDKQRVSRLLIINQSGKTNAYSFDWQQRVQKDGGGMILLEEGQTHPGHRSASEYIVFSPRRVILADGERQTVRILVRRTEDMEPGEYHSHILIKADPVEAQQPSVDKPGVGGTITFHTYTALPVFLHHGPTQVSVSLNDVTFYERDGREYINVDLSNNSTRSLYLRPKVTCYNAQGVQTNQRAITTVKVYSEASHVVKEIPVPKGESFAGCGRIHLQLFGTTDFEYRNKVVVEATARRL